MRIPTDDDFRALEQWGLVERPLAAIDDYSESRAARRDENERHRRAREAYDENQPTAFVEDSQAFYRSMDRPIDRTKWEYLKRRKAWFIPPLEWNRFASPGTSRILDLGCGDGDVSQRIAEFVTGTWICAGYDGFPMEVVGVDLSAARIENARLHAESPHPKITLRFEQADAVSGLEFGDDYFDYTVLAGLLEVLDDDVVEAALDEAVRLTANGIFVQDMLDDHPGITPRPDLPELLDDRGFDVVAHHRVFEEPFVAEGTRDPLDVWPMSVHQLLFAEAREPVSPEERY